MATETTFRLRAFDRDDLCAETIVAELQIMGSIPIGPPCTPAEPPGPGELIVASFLDSDQDRRCEVQAQVLRAGAVFLPVEKEPDSIAIGPLTEAKKPGCLDCMSIWSRTEWSEVRRGRSHACAAELAAPALLAPLAAQLTEALIEERGDCSFITLNAETLEAVQHRFIPHPYCQRCRGLMERDDERFGLRWTPRPKSDPAQLRERGAVDLDEIKARFLDRKTGLIRYLFNEPTSTLMPMAVASFLQDGTATTFENGYGRSVNERASFATAAMEVLERYCGYMPRRRVSLKRASYREVAADAVDPRDFILHGREQAEEPGYGFVPYDDDLQIDWLKAYSVRQNRDVLVPEQFVFYRLPEGRNRPTNRFVYEVSNGCAVGGSIEEAALHGLFEVIERDAFLATWYARERPVELDPSDAKDESIRALVARSQSGGYDLRLFDISTGLGVTAIWAMIVNPRDDAPVKTYCAAGASIDPEKAIFSALVEVCTSIPVYERKLPAERERAAAMVADSSLVKTMEDHVLLYSHEAAFGRFDFLFGGPRIPLRERFAAQDARRPADDVTADLRAVCDAILEQGYDVLVFDQSFPELADAGFRCAKVLVPGLLPVTFGHQYRRIGLDRINALYRRDGVPFTDADINPYPHNFP